MQAQLTDIKDLKSFALAGNATLTLKSLKTGNHFTYKVTAPYKGKRDFDSNVRFVSVLTGPDNSNDFTFLGTIFRDNTLLKHSLKSPIGMTAPSWKAFNYFWENMLGEKKLPDTLEVYHEGQCARCGRKLTVPESIESGFGPECIKFMNL